MKHTVWALFVALFALGCSSGDAPKGPDMGGGDGVQVSGVVDEMNDAVGNPKRLAALFAAGSKPPDAAKTKGLSFSIAGKPAVTGTTATAKVRIEGGQSGEQEWSFEKDGDKWKIKSAPLP